jgi:hypothetical protein
MLIKEFKALSLKGSEHIEVTLRNGKVLIGILLNDYLNLDEILIYNLGIETKNPEEFIKMAVIRDLKII